MSLGKPWGELVGLCDRSEDALAFIESHPPIASRR
jgi:hypothetical protein